MSTQPKLKLDFLGVICLSLCLLGSPILTLFIEQGAEFPMVQFPAVLTWYVGSVLISLILAAFCSRFSQQKNRFTPVMGALLLLHLFSLFLAFCGGNQKLSLAIDTLGLMAHKTPLFFIVWAFAMGGGGVGILLFFFFSKRFQKARRVAAFLLSFALLGTDLIHFGQVAYRFIRTRTEPAPETASQSNPVAPPQNAASVIHLVLDEMSGKSILEDPVLNSHAFYRKTSAGTYFTQAHSNALHTHPSMRQVLSGKLDTTLMGSHPSPLLKLFEKAGYQIHLYLNAPQLPCSIAPQAECYDQNWAIKNILTKGDTRELFYFQMETLAQLFRYRLSLRRSRFRLTSSIEEKTGTSIPLALAKKALERISEVNSPAYHLIHLLIPHESFIHDEECRIVPDATDYSGTMDQMAKSIRASYARQMYCANVLALRLIQELQKMKKYDDAFVVIQSDHGFRMLSSEKTDLCTLTEKFNEDTSHMVLWLKPPHMKEAKVETRLVQALDIPTTLAQYFGLDTKGMEGRDLLSPALKPLAEVKIFGRNECGK